MGSAARREPRLEPWLASQRPMRAQQQLRPRAPRQPTTQLSSLKLPLLIRSAGGFGRSPSACPAHGTGKVPDLRPDPGAFGLHYGKFRPVTARRGKPKTMATAAFLGESGLYRQKDVACCVNVTNSIRQTIQRCAGEAACVVAAQVFHTCADTGELILQRRRFELTPPRLFFGLPRAASQPAPQCRR